MLDKKYMMGILILVVFIVSFLIGRATVSNTTSATTTTVATTNSGRGIYTTPPTFKGTGPYVPSGMKFLVNGDTFGNDLSDIDNITLDQAAAQMPTSAVGFVFVVTDNLLINVKSIGHAYYKKTVDFIPHDTIDTYRRANNKQTYEKLSKTDTLGNDIGAGNGTYLDAIKACQTISSCDGFTSDGTRFGLKSNIAPYSYYNWTSYLYVKSTYTPPTRTWVSV